LHANVKGVPRVSDSGKGVRRFPLETAAHHEIDLPLDQRSDESMDVIGAIGIAAVDHDAQVAVHVPKDALHHITFAAALCE
jgi:hypothetical protein